VLTGRNRRDALWLILLGVILLASDRALSIWAGPSITPAFGRSVDVAMLSALAALGIAAVLLGGYRFARTFGREASNTTPS
jgi:hypothetical protein